MTQSYDALAKWFEILNDDCDYPSWSQYLLDGMKKLGAGRRGLELGCGSGAFCRAFSAAGYEMTGGDVSEPMLTEAARLARENGLAISYLKMDAARPRSLEPYDFILSPNDCYNYLPPDKLPSAFRGAAKCLRRSGIFWFDLSSPYKFRTKIANNVMADDRDEITYISFNKLSDDHVETDVTLFVKRADGAFDRFDERHIQFIHEEENVLGALKAAGFEVLSVEGHLGGEIRGSDRINYICRKK